MLCFDFFNFIASLSFFVALIKCLVLRFQYSYFTPPFNFFFIFQFLLFPRGMLTDFLIVEARKTYFFGFFVVFVVFLEYCGKVVKKTRMLFVCRSRGAPGKLFFCSKTKIVKPLVSPSTPFFVFF